VMGTTLLRANNAVIEQATIVVFRDKLDVGHAYPIRSTEEQFGTLHAGQRIVLTLPSGTYQLIADDNARQRFFVEAKAGDTLFVHVGKAANQTTQNAMLEMSSIQSFIDFAPGPR
jgi:hypothetical protein